MAQRRTFISNHERLDHTKDTDPYLRLSAASLAWASCRMPGGTTYSNLWLSSSSSAAAAEDEEDEEEEEEAEEEEAPPRRRLMSRPPPVSPTATVSIRNGRDMTFSSGMLFWWRASHLHFNPSFSQTSVDCSPYRFIGSSTSPRSKVRRHMRLLPGSFGLQLLPTTSFTTFASGLSLPLRSGVGWWEGEVVVKDGGRWWREVGGGGGWWRVVGG